MFHIYLDKFVISVSTYIYIHIFYVTSHLSLPKGICGSERLGQTYRPLGLFLPQLAVFVF